ncbi:MAG: RNA polymerase sigma factor [Sulfuritalea sp.]|nr:RNA polymerase sigma factor [Sulfuritalea sp.]
MPRAAAHDLAALLVAYRNGGRAAQAAACKISAYLWPRFMRHFMRHGITEGAAEELVQDALVKVFRHADTLHDVQAFSAWASRIATNVLIDDRRHPDRDDAIEIDVDDDTWFVLMDGVAGPAELDPLTRICLDRQMADFVDRHPERAYCLERIELDGWSLDMLAVYLERSYEAAKEYLSQCRKVLRKHLQECLE